MPAPSRGNVVFYTDCRPPLTAGTYRLEVRQSVTKDGQRVDAGSTKPLPDASVHRFEVSGPRFVMDPGELHAVYPPANSRGNYTSDLPLVVLRRRTLPWERTIDGLPAGTAGAPPWLALLLFEEREVTLLDPPSCTVGFVVNEAGTVSVAPVQLPNLRSEERAAALAKPCLGVEVAFSTFKQVAPMLSELGLLTHVRQVSTQDKELLGLDEDGWFAVVVGNRVPEAGRSYIACLVALEGYGQYLPTDAETPAFTAEDLAALSIRPIRRPATAVGRLPGVIAVPIIPTMPTIPTIPIFPPPLPTPPTAPTGLVVTPVSHTQIALRWTDTSANETSFFVERCQGGGCTAFVPLARLGMNVTSYTDTGLSPSTSYSYRVRAVNAFGSSGYTAVATAVTHPPPIERIRLLTLARWRFTCQAGGDFEGLMRALPAKGGVAMLGAKGPTVLETGHVPLRHATRAGEETTSWYRGPLVPTVIARETGGPYHSADQARRVDVQTGMENVGYAAAFEIGRLLALSDPTFDVELLRWRRRGYRTRYMRLVKRNLEPMLPSLLQQWERLTHIPIVRRTLNFVGAGIQRKNWVGALADPTGLVRLRTTMPGLHAPTVARAMGLKPTTVSGIFKAPLEGASGLLDAAGVRTDLPLGGAVDFDGLSDAGAAELGHLQHARTQLVDAAKPGGF
jgi:hypothetical protein